MAKRANKYRTEVLLKRVSNNIRVLRVAAGLTQRDLAKMIGVEPAAVWGWENGKCLPSGNSTVKLAKVFHIPAEDLFNREFKLTVLSNQ